MGGTRNTFAFAISIAISLAIAAFYFAQRQNRNEPATKNVETIEISSIRNSTTSSLSRVDSPSSASPAADTHSALRMSSVRNIDELKKLMRFDPQKFDFIDHKWKLVSNLIAIPVTDETKSRTGSLLRFQSLDLLESENGLVDLRGKPVVFFPERNRVGFISGSLIIRLADQKFQKKVSDQYGLKVEQFFENISTLIANTESFAELLRVRSQLLKDDRIKTIEVEIVENNLERQ